MGEAPYGEGVFLRTLFLLRKHGLAGLFSSCRDSLTK